MQRRERLLEAMIIIIEVLKVFVEAERLAKTMRVTVKAVRVLLEA